MRRVDRELGPGVWEEPEEWRDKPYRDPILAKLIIWHDLRVNHDLLEIFPKYTRAYYLAHGMPFDVFLKCVYNDRKIRAMRRDSVLLQLLSPREISSSVNFPHS